VRDEAKQPDAERERVHTLDDIVVTGTRTE